MKINHTLEQYPTLVFWLTCLLLSVLQYFFGLQHFYYDAERYWESGRELSVNGQFSLYNHVTQRGILFPLINYGIIEVLGKLNWHEISVFKCLNTVFVCWGLWQVVPSLFLKATGIRFTVLKRLALISIVHFFWFRHISCPMSDFLCLILLLKGFDLLWSDQPTLVKVIVAGIVCGFVFNTRPIYNLLLLVYPVFMWVNAHQTVWRKLIMSVVLVAAACMVNIPQVLVNQKVWGVQSIFQPTDKYYNGVSLYLGQLRWGLYIQKYDTYVGDTNCYSSAQVFYGHNKEQMNREREEANQIQDYAQYVSFITLHPLKLAWFAKNFFNGLDQQYNSPYVFRLQSPGVFSALNYAVWFLGVMVLWLGVKARKIKSQMWWIAGYIGFTCALCVPIAIEPRFMLVLFILIYVLVIAYFDQLIERWRSITTMRRIAFIGLFIVFMIGCFILSFQTFAQLEHQVNC